MFLGGILTATGRALSVPTQWLQALSSSNIALLFSVNYRAMLRCVCHVLIAVLLTGLEVSAQTRPLDSDRIWFSPNPGTLDMLRMFEHPEEWSRARNIINVFNITQQHTFASDSIIGPNTYPALVNVDAFRKLVRWGKKLSIGVGAVKEFYCTTDASGMNESIVNTLDAVAKVTQAGGRVDYLSMDEPWVSGRSKKCGGPALEPTADRVALYMSSVSRAYPLIKIGLIEAYPFSSADAIESMLSLLRSRNATPAFLHMDVDWHSLNPGEFERDMRRLRDVCHAQGMPFGIIITGYNGDADALYALDAAGIAHLIAQTFLRWNDMPEHLMFDSWVESGTGLRITPNNLPETRLYTHTRLAFDIFRYLRGVQMPLPSGTAVPR
jgi:hypothetical protein